MDLIGLHLHQIARLHDLGVMNPTAVFVPGSLTLVAATIPPGADTSNTNPIGGTNGAGIIDIRNLDLPANSQVAISGAGPPAMTEAS